jgi:hypothetical protein
VSGRDIVVSENIRASKQLAQLNVIVTIHTRRRSPAILVVFDKRFDYISPEILLEADADERDAELFRHVRCIESVKRGAARLSLALYPRANLSRHGTTRLFLAIDAHMHAHQLVSLSLENSSRYGRIYATGHRY